MANGGAENEAYKHMSIGKAQSLGTDKVNEIFGLMKDLVFYFDQIGLIF